MFRPSENVAGGGHLPTAVYVTMIIAGFILSLFVVFEMSAVLGDNRARIGRIVSVLVNLILTATLFEAIFFVLECRKLATNPSLRRIHRAVIRSGDDHVAPGATPNYQPHHYLNYTINPSVPYLGTLQYNATYKIRRSQPILQRDEIDFRVLALGGSTTFGEHIDLAEETWPERLEQLLRQQGSCEVINGGIGGYNLLENMLHYVTLLSDLEPDLVLLYEGINDVHPRFYPTVELDYSNYRRPWRLDTPTRLPHPWLRSSSTYRYLHTVSKLEPLASLGIHDAVSLAYPNVEVRAERLSVNPPIQYQRHLEDFVQFLRGQDIEVVIIPQYFVARSKDDLIFAQGVHENNAVNAEVA